jgi:hypothetical protein
MELRVSQKNPLQLWMDIAGRGKFKRAMDLESAQL